MKVIGLVGPSGAGKTTLLSAMLPLLRAAGLSVSTVKHAHHGFDLDRPGKDSHRHREAGALEVMVAGPERWALLHEHPRSVAEPALAELLARMTPVDLVLVEGFRSHPHPKIEVYRPALGEPPLWPGRGDIVAVASDSLLPTCPRHVLPLGAPATIADWLLGFMALRRGDATTGAPVVAGAGNRS
ncbi:MAG TPA: molybdopterin-guanine dinucleotide biosynthesis protein B [Acetobacteraceae bacterium]|nr:molybdopterin-guanine dinucleotide biosynthesis protein B [Acetobacteraceae bacterium]